MQDGTWASPSHIQETAASRHDASAANCPTRRLLDRIGDKWSVLILLLLGKQDMRFNGLRRQIGDVSQKMLSQTLRSLERDGLASRAVEPTVPVTVTYSITPLGRELLTALLPMIAWAQVRMADVAAAQRSYDQRDPR